MSDKYTIHLKKEYIGLQERIKKLTKMLEDWENGELLFVPKCPKELYMAQLDAMNRYLCALDARIILEEINF